MSRFPELAHSLLDVGFGHVLPFVRRPNGMLCGVGGDGWKARRGRRADHGRALAHERARDGASRQAASPPPRRDRWSVSILVVLSYLMLSRACATEQRVRPSERSRNGREKLRSQSSSSMGRRAPRSWASPRRGPTLSMPMPSLPANRRSPASPAIPSPSRRRTRRTCAYSRNRRSDLGSDPVGILHGWESRL